jgi:CRP-like cAMP-binding protein
MATSFCEIQVNLYPVRSLEGRTTEASDDCNLAWRILTAQQDVNRRLALSKIESIVAERETEAVHAGERTNGEGKTVSNTILLAIPDDEFAAVRGNLEHVEVAHHGILYEPRQKIEFVFFPNSGMVSLVFHTNGGDSVEIGIVGYEGFVPVQAAAGLRSCPYQAIMQINGDGFRMDVEALAAAAETCPRFHSMLNRYAALHGLQVAQTAGCNRLHDLEQRLSRWLLLTQDRVGSGLLKITHDFLATMLGTDRPSVTLAAGALQKKKIIEYSHGSVRVLNRKKLENSACECYEVIQNYKAELAK